MRIVSFFSLVLYDRPSLLHRLLRGLPVLCYVNFEDFGVDFELVYYLQIGHDEHFDGLESISILLESYVIVIFDGEYN